MNEKPQYKIYIDSTKMYEKLVRLVEVGSDDGEEIVDEIFGDIEIAGSVKKLLDKHGLKPENIENYDANPGPGSFTGIKIGVTVANVLNWAVHKTPLNKLIKPEYGSEPNIQK